MTSLEQAVQGYWRAARAARCKNEEQLSTSQAAHLCVRAERLPPRYWRLKELAHVLKYDIIEGDTKWRDNPAAKTACQLIPLTTSFVSMMDKEIPKN